MKVRLVSYTVPMMMEVPEIRTPEDLMVYCARVSNPSNQANVETGERLLRYCMEHGHWSVFEQASMTVEIQTSRAIAAQLLRHRSFSFQEFSQRYAEAAGIERVELRKQAHSNRQSSTEEIDDPGLSSGVQVFNIQAQQFYDELINAGVARECARMVLPLATKTTLYMTGTCRSWIHYLQQRLSEHAQKEHRLVAEEILRYFRFVFPIVGELL